MADDAVTTTGGKLDIDGFAKAITDRLPGIFETRGYVYGRIRIESAPKADNSLVPTIHVEMPDLKGNDICFFVDNKYSQYCTAYEDDNVDIEECLDEMASQLGEAFNAENIKHIKYSAGYDKLVESLDNDEFLLSHAYPELIDTSRISIEADDKFGRWITAPLMPDVNPDGLPDLAYAFQVMADDGTMGIRLRDGSREFTPDFIAAVRDQALVNLNGYILPHLVTMNSVEFQVRMSYPIELPMEIQRRIVADLKERVTIPTFAVMLDKTPLAASAVLLSRTAMLKVAKYIGANKKIQVVPFHISGFLMLSADDPEKTIPIEKAEETVRELIDANPDKARTLLARPLIYDVITGSIS